VQRWVLEWQMQDLKCVKCAVLQGDTAVFGEHCTCGGKWEGSVDRNVVRERIGVTERVAGAYQLRMLGAVLEKVRGLM
jgi:hypothetical protein